MNKCISLRKAQPSQLGGAFAFTTAFTGLLYLAASLAGCSRVKESNIAEFKESILTEPASLADFPVEVPAYGISTGSPGAVQFDLNIEAGDANQVHTGQRARVFIGNHAEPIDAQVIRIVKNVSTETGQALAWLKPAHPITAASLNLPLNDFVHALITTRVAKEVLSVPSAAVFVREGKSWVIVKSKNKENGQDEFRPVQIKTGETARGRVAVLSGIEAGASIVTQGGIGALYPDFKAGTGD